MNTAISNLTPKSTNDYITSPQVVDCRCPRDGLPTVTNTPELLTRAVQKLASGHGPIAIDTERASGFRYSQRAYLIQLRREGSGTFLIDPLTCGNAAALAQVLSEPEWIIHAASQDLPCLRELGLVPSALFDTELAARLLGKAHVGLGAVVEQILGVHLAKDHAAADWSTRPLPTTWLNYAALDVEFLIEIRQALATELKSAGRAAWAEQEFAHILKCTGQSIKIDPWRKLPRSGRAMRSQRSLAVLRELWTSREELAKELDLPPTKILPHAAIVSAAATLPTSRRKLMKLHDFSSRQARQYQERWWRALERALQLPENQLPPMQTPQAPNEPPAPRTWSRYHIEATIALDEVRTSVRQQAAKLGIAQELLLAPKIQRHLAWQIGQAEADHRSPDVSARQIAAHLEALGARPWQIEQLSQRLSDALA